MGTQMSQSLRVVHEVISLPMAPQVLSRNERAGPEIPKINSSSDAPPRVFLNLTCFLLHSWAYFLNFRPLLPLLEPKRALLISPSSSSPSMYAFIHLCLQSFSPTPQGAYGLGNVGMQESYGVLDLRLLGKMSIFVYVSH